MTNSILIGKIIYSKLSSSETLTTMLGEENKIFPIIADNDVKYPFVVYKRLSVSSTEVTKDGYGEDLVSFEITVVTNNYVGSLNIANEIRKILEKKKIESNIMNIYNNKIQNISEDYVGDAYVQKLIFTCNIN